MSRNEEAVGEVPNDKAAKSRKEYQKEYRKFEDWLHRNAESFDEAVLIKYFQELTETHKPVSIGCKFSRLRSEIQTHHKVDIKCYSKLASFLKEYSKTYIPKKCTTLTLDDVLKFFREAPTDIYLLEKMIMMMSTFGDLKKNDMMKLTVEDVVEKGNYLIVKSQTTMKTLMIEEESDIHALQLYRKYIALRPKGLKDRRFFLAFRDGKCPTQPLSKNFCWGVTSKVAKYLGYANFNEYTGKFLRHPSVTLGIGSADFQSLKMFRDSTVAALGYDNDDIPPTKLVKLFNESGSNCDNDDS